MKHSQWLCRGEGYSLNVPLDDGLTDEMYVSLFKATLGEVVRRYQPNAVVFQSGDIHFPSLLYSPRPLGPPS